MTSGILRALLHVGTMVWLAVALGVATAVLFTAWRYARGRLATRIRPSKRPAARAPIVLAHGVLGFTEIGKGQLKQEYFRGVAARLRAAGHEVHTVKVSPSASIATRAAQLAEAVRAIPAERVNIIAHSMGGLDARYAISRLGLAAKVASLTTLGTPHLGTPIADIGTSVGDKLKLRHVLEALGLDVAGFYDCTTEKMAAFNAEVKDAPSVLYASYVGSVRGRLPRVNPLLLPAYLYLAQQGAESDGVVPASSQGWGTVLGRVQADHWAQIGWSRRFDAPGFYASLVCELQQRGA